MNTKFMAMLFIVIKASSFVFILHVFVIILCLSAGICCLSVAALHLFSVALHICVIKSEAVVVGLFQCRFAGEPYTQQRLSSQQRLNFSVFAHTGNKEKLSPLSRAFRHSGSTYLFIYSVIYSFSQRFHRISQERMSG